MLLRFNKILNFNIKESGFKISFKLITHTNVIMNNELIAVLNYKG